jgi:hypothetical protein
MDVADNIYSRSMSMSISMTTSMSVSTPTRSVSCSPSPRPRRRASQGSVSTQRAGIRFLSKDSAALHSPFSKYPHPRSSYRYSSRASSSALQPMSLDTALPRDSSHPDNHSLPLTPPADEEDEHAAWVMQSVEPKPQVLMDESRDRHSASPTQCQRDSIDSSSFNAGPDRRRSDNDDVNMTDSDMHDHSPPENWLENGIKATRKSPVAAFI